MPDELIELVVEAGGERLDKYLARRLRDVSRTQIQRWIEAGRVRVDGKTRPANSKLSTGAGITIDVPPPEPTALRAEAIPLSVLYEDQDLIVLDKPPGLVVHPAAGHASGTLVNALLHHAPDLVTGDVERPGIVHRLDRDTSGVILVAKNDRALRNLQNQFRSRSIQKTYLAIVRGRPATRKGKIEAPIGRDPRHRQRMAVRAGGEKSRAAETEFVVRARAGDYALLEIHPHTGRTHQIRVHLAFIGLPIVGDPVYGRGGSPAPADRQLLHAWKISLDHPTSGDRREFTAPPPADFSRALEALGLGRGLESLRSAG